MSPKLNYFKLFNSTFVYAVITGVVFPIICDFELIAQEKNQKTKSQKPTANQDEFAKYGIYAKSAPRAGVADPIETKLPLAFNKGDRIALVGNTLLERSQFFGQFESLLQQQHPSHKLIVRNLAWSADTPDLRPRPKNFADLDQHLTHEKADVIVASYGFNESFAGPEGIAAYKQSLGSHVTELKSKAFNGKSAVRVVLVSPIANENIKGVPAADLNNGNLKLYVDAMRAVAQQENVAFVDVFTPTLSAMKDPKTDLTINGCHLNEEGYGLFGRILSAAVSGKQSTKINENLRQEILDKNRQYARRYRPVNTFYYTGDRNKSYGYLDFLPAMRNFDMMVTNREQRIWKLADHKDVSAKVDDSNVPPLPEAKQSRGANRWITAAEELKEFKIDPRFEVNLFAGEEEFPDIAAPIQMRWDAKGRLWVSCSTTYPHVYPGNEPNDKIVVLEDTDGDGKADKSTVFADDLHIPLSFEFGDGGVYVSEEPHLTFIKDTDGDGKADYRRRVLTGFGTEDSHHALHDFAWTPDGDLIFRESIFHHSQVETPYGPVRQQNSGWFRFEPRTQRLTAFGTYHSTNPWGVTFDDWGQHMASHPIYAAAFHALDPPFPTQHPTPRGLQAYSGTCGQEFVDFATFPDELQGGFIKARYKPTNRIEIHKWNEGEFGYDEEYVSDLIFSSNLSFIPVDIRYGPRGAMYVCDWYNPIKGHAQYSLRDDRRDRHSGRIWRITAKGKPLQDRPNIDGASIEELLDILKLPEYRYRYWAKRELRARDSEKVKQALDQWVKNLDQNDPRFRHHQIEAVWAYRNVDQRNTKLLRTLIQCDNHHARAAAVQQLRYWHPYMDDAIALLNRAVNDPKGIVRMEGVIAATYVGTKDALDAVLDVLKHPHEKHLKYAILCSFGSKSMQRHWKNNPDYHLAQMLRKASRAVPLKEPRASASQKQFDRQKNLKKVNIGCIPERMRYTVEQIVVTVGQPIKIVFTNPDATDHNLVVVQPGKLAEVGMAANDMAKDPKFANSNFIPAAKKPLILSYSPMIGPGRKSRIHVLRFMAPTKPGIYPYVCTFPGHWVVMKGEIVVAEKLEDVESMLAAAKPAFVKEWKLSDFDKGIKLEGRDVMKGMQAFAKAGCNQCHVVAGHGVPLGPELTKIKDRFKGQKLLQQILEPSTELNKDYQTIIFEMVSGKQIIGFVKEETKDEVKLLKNVLTPDVVTTIKTADIEFREPSKVSSMPEGLSNVLTKDEILDMVAFLQLGFHLPEHLKGKHDHGHTKKE